MTAIWESFHRLVSVRWGKSFGEFLSQSQSFNFYMQDNRRRMLDRDDEVQRSATCRGHGLEQFPGKRAVLLPLPAAVR
jgi:hypothetical protein